MSRMEEVSVGREDSTDISRELSSRNANIESSEGNGADDPKPARKKPDLALLEEDFANIQKRRRRFLTVRRTAFTLVTVASIAVLVAILWMPVLHIYGESMTPTLYGGDIVVSMKAKDMKPGDIVAFYYNNEVLVKRLVGVAGDWIDIDAEGNVYLNGVLLNEPYVREKALGECNIKLPYQVPENRVFVMGDHRSVSIDSRNTAVGCVAQEQMVGKIVFRLWPLPRFSFVR